MTFTLIIFKNTKLKWHSTWSSYHVPNLTCRRRLLICQSLHINRPEHSSPGFGRKWFPALHNCQDSVTNSVWKTVLSCAWPTARASTGRRAAEWAQTERCEPEDPTRDWLGLGTPSARDWTGTVRNRLGPGHLRTSITSRLCLEGSHLRETAGRKKEDHWWAGQDSLTAACCCQGWGHESGPGGRGCREPQHPMSQLRPALSHCPSVTCRLTGTQGN